MFLIKKKRQILSCFLILFWILGCFLCFNLMPIQDPETLTEVEWLQVQKEFALNYDLGQLLIKWSKFGALILILFFLFLDSFYAKKNK